MYNPISDRWLKDNRIYLRYLCYLIFLIPAFLFRDYTPSNELKYISIAEEALRNNTWFTFYYQNEIYADKPPLYLWLIMLSKIITGHYSIGLIGLFSLLPCIGVIAVMDKWLKNEKILINPLVPNLMLLTTVMFLGTSLVVRMDMLMTFFIVLSLYTFYKMYKKGDRAGANLLPVFIFLALFTKGPLGLLIPLLSIALFLMTKKQIKTFGRYIGWKQWLILIGLCVLWFIFVYMEGGKDFLHNLLVKQTIGRGINSFHHKQPFWFYFPRMLWSFAPWSILCVVLMYKGMKDRAFHADLEKFFLVIISSGILLLSLVSAKLDVYLLPIYPFLIYLSSILLERNIQNRAVKISIGIPALLLILILPSTLILRDKIPDLGYYKIFALLGIVALTVGSLTSIVNLLKKHTLRAITALSMGIIGLVFIASFAIPPLNKYIGFREMAKSAKIASKEDVRYAYYKFKTAASMDVYLGSPLKRIDSIAQIDSIEQDDFQTILFVRDKEKKRDRDFGDWINKRNPIWMSGEYSWYLLGAK